MEPSSLVPLIIPTLPADVCTPSEANTVLSGLPSTSHTHSTAYPSPLVAPIPFAASHTHNSPSGTSRDCSDTSLTTLCAHYSLNYDTSLPEHKRCRPKGSIKVKPVTYRRPTSKARTASWKWVQADAEFIVG